MPSKDIKPKQRLGQTTRSRKRKLILLTLAGVACAAGVYAAYHYTGTTEVDVPVARVRRGDFVIRNPIANVHGDLHRRRKLFPRDLPELRLHRLMAIRHRQRRRDRIHP